MKRLSLILASSLLVAGCATAPTAQRSGPLPTTRTFQDQNQTDNQNLQGQTQPLPSQQAPAYSNGNINSQPDNQQGNAPGNAGGNAYTQGQTGQTGQIGQIGQTENGSSSSQGGSQQQPQPPKTAQQASSPAVMSLLNRADTLAKNGNMEQAASTLERAQDLAPRNPFIYQRLAAVRLAEGQPQQAEQIAMKSNSLADNNPFVQAGNWQLIAEARKSTGDTKGEQQAQAQAVNFRQSASQYGQ